MALGRLKLFKNSNNDLIKLCKNELKSYSTFKLPYIRDNLFIDCSSLEELKLTGNISNVGSNILDGCSGLKSLIIDIPTLSKNLGKFGNSETVVTISPKFKTAADTGIFDNAVISKVNYLGTLDDWGKITFNNSYNSNPIEKSGNLYINDELVTEIPNTVTNFNDFSYQGCRTLTTLNLNNNITEIPAYCFDKTGITTLNIPESVTYIGYGAFRNSSLTSLETSSNTTITFGSWAFENCNFTELVVPSNFDLSSSHQVFRLNDKLTTVTLSEGITNTGQQTFRSCSNLTTVNLPQSLTTIGPYAFADCTKITTITIPANVSSIGTYAFDTGLTSIRFEQPADMSITIPSTKMFDKTKSARNIKVYCENEVFKNYDYSSDNYNPTFYHLDGTVWE